MLKKETYRATADIIEKVHELMEAFEENNKYYTPAAKRLASKVLMEWSRSLKKKIKKDKKPKKIDAQMAVFLEGYAKFLQ